MLRLLALLHGALPPPPPPDDTQPDDAGQLPLLSMQDMYSTPPAIEGETDDVVNPDMPVPPPAVDPNADYNVNGLVVKGSQLIQMAYNNNAQDELIRQQGDRIAQLEGQVAQPQQPVANEPPVEEPLETMYMQARQQVVQARTGEDGTVSNEPLTFSEQDILYRAMEQDRLNAEQRASEMVPQEINRSLQQLSDIQNQHTQKEAAAAAAFDGFVNELMTTAEHHGQDPNAVKQAYIPLFNEYMADSHNIARHNTLQEVTTHTLTSLRQRYDTLKSMGLHGTQASVNTAYGTQASVNAAYGTQTQPVAQTVATPLPTSYPATNRPVPPQPQQNTRPQASAQQQRVTLPPVTPVQQQQQPQGGNGRYPTFDDAIAQFSRGVKQNNNYL